MRPTRHRTAAWGAALLALAVTGGTAPATAVTADEPAPAAEGTAQAVVLSEDFEDGDYSPWTQSGSPALEVTPSDGGSALLVSGRTEDFDGIKSPAALEAGVDHTLTMRVRLAEGTEGTASARFVTDPGYTWVGATDVSADGWTTVQGTYTPTEDTAVFIGTSDIPGLEDGYDYLVDDIVITTADGGGDDGGEVGPGFSTDFETGLDGWGPRADAQGPPSVTLTEDAHSGQQAALVSDRTSQGDGIGRDVTGLLTPGTTYEISAWVRFAAGAETDDVWLSAQRTAGGADTFDTIGQFSTVTASGWTQVEATYQVPASTERLYLYLETAYPDGSTGDLLVDDVVATAQDRAEVQDLTPLKDTLPFPTGVAIDSRETGGAAAELLLRHFDQVTGENHMKPEAWYAGDGPDTFRTHPEAAALMDFAAENDLGLYGHVLVWHSQTPAWFFTDAAGQPLTTSEEDQQVLRERMRTHIFAVAQTLSEEYGDFGSETNPLVAWDVVNEVIADTGEYPDGMRRSEWYRILGEEFVDLAFQYADEAFNDVYAAEGTDRPVTLFINDYNTEQGGKQERLYSLVERLLARDVPVDGVGHQFHVSLSRPVADLEAAIVRFQDLGLVQVVTELDVTTGTPVTEAALIEQGYYYRDAFRIFREYAEDLFSVTVWGLTDDRSWRVDSGAPLLFDGGLQAKPAYFGAVDGELAPRQRTAFVFAGDVAPVEGAVDDLAWSQLPLLPVEDVAGFQLRWTEDSLTAYVRVEDATVEDTDGVEIVVAGETYSFGRDGEGDVEGVVSEVDGGWAAVLEVPLAGAAEGDLVSFDLRVVDGGTTTGWNEPGTLGTLTLVEPLSYTEVVETPVAPTIDGEVDAAWAEATTITTDTQIEGTGGATAEVRTLWEGNTLYVLAEVTDPVLDASGSDPWIQDSVELFVDAGNYKNGPYRYDDTQIRISYENVVSFGSGDEGFQQNRLESATSVVEGGYVVEAAVSLLEEGGEGTFHGFDVQVNDASGGARTGIRTWADPTGLGYQSTARWGVVQLVADDEPAFEPDPQVSVGTRLVRAGGEIDVAVSGFLPGSDVELALESTRGRNVLTTELGTVVVGEDGAAQATLTVPADTPKGRHALVAGSGDLTATAAEAVVVRGGPPAGRG